VVDCAQDFESVVLVTEASLDMVVRTVGMNKSMNMLLGSELVA